MIKDLVPGEIIRISSDTHEIINIKVNAFGDYSLRFRGDELRLCICIKTKSIFKDSHKNK